MFAKTIEKVKKEGIKEGKYKDALNMYKKGYDIKTISDITELSISETRKILEIKE